MGPASGKLFVIIVLHIVLALALALTLGAMLLLLLVMVLGIALQVLPVVDMVSAIILVQIPEPVQHSHVGQLGKQQKAPLH